MSIPAKKDGVLQTFEKHIRHILINPLIKHRISSDIFL